MQKAVAVDVYRSISWVQTAMESLAGCGVHATPLDKQFVLGGKVIQGYPAVRDGDLATVQHCLAWLSATELGERGSATVRAGKANPGLSTKRCDPRIAPGEIELYVVRGDGNYFGALSGLYSGERAGGNDWGHPDTMTCRLGLNQPGRWNHARQQIRIRVHGDVDARGHSYEGSITCWTLAGNQKAGEPKV